MNAEQLARMVRRALNRTEQLMKAEEEHQWLYPWCMLGQGEARRWLEKTKLLVQRAEALAGTTK